jgi:hypothetical protein
VYRSFKDVYGSLAPYQYGGLEITHVNAVQKAVKQMSLSMWDAHLVLFCRVNVESVRQTKDEAEM